MRVCHRHDFTRTPDTVYSIALTTCYTALSRPSHIYRIGDIASLRPSHTHFFVTSTKLYLGPTTFTFSHSYPSSLFHSSSTSSNNTMTATDNVDRQTMERKQAILGHMKHCGLPHDVLHALDKLSFFSVSSPFSPSSSVEDAVTYFRQIHVLGMQNVLNSPLVIDYASSLLSHVSESEQLIHSVDGNDIRVFITTPKETHNATVPRKYVLYLHSGAMAIFSTGAAGYRAWCRLIAREGLSVVAVEFRNCAFSLDDNCTAHPFPAGLDDCVSALKWLAARDDVDDITVVGESGGGNLALTTCVRLAKQDTAGKYHYYSKVSGIVSWDPYVAGPATWRSWNDQTDLPSLKENNGACIFSPDLFHMGRMYTPEEDDWTNGEAWPLFLTDDEIDLLPQTVVHTSELDSFRDEGVKLTVMLEKRKRLKKHVRHERTTHTVHTYAPAMGMTEKMEEAAKSVAGFALRGASEKEKEKEQIKGNVARI